MSLKVPLGWDSQERLQNNVLGGEGCGMMREIGIEMLGRQA